MRPVRLEVEGFSAYRGAVTVDFEGADFFSISGPTGSGKSSLIDAMVFALYGRVPRLGGNAVAPAITAGTDRARVRFYFETDGRVCDATRLAQRTQSGGASVREARLQIGETVVAEGADDVTAAIVDLLKLTFDDFTRTVVLPQGDFARFLRATKAERQGLLRNLLGLDVYTTMRELARTRAAVAGQRAESASRSLEALELPEEATREAAVSHRDAVEALAESFPGREKEVADLDAAARAAHDLLAKTADALTRLDAIEAPDRLDQLDSLVTEARSAAVEAGASHEQALEALHDLEAKLAELPDAGRIAGWRRTMARRSDLEERLATEGSPQAPDHAEDAARRLEAGMNALEEARSSVTAARATHAAHLLAAGLVVGDDCPVCGQRVDELPEPGEVPGLAEIEQAQVEAEAAVGLLRAESDQARTALAAIEATRAALVERLQSAVEDLDDAPEDLESVEAEVARLGSAITGAREDLTASEAAVTAAQRRLEDLADAARRVARGLTEAQLTVADLGPPVSEADDVTVQWKDLLSWRDRRADALRLEIAESEGAMASADEAARAALASLVAALEAVGIAPVEPLAAQVAISRQAARADVESHEKALALSLRLTAEITGAGQESAVATALANHLRANGFEQWLMSGALADLVTGANQLLDQLSGGGYSLHSDETGSFSIIDHRNADEMRRVETLSGGETFLVSLALALSLAETLAEKGGSGLEAIILDEGFGTLDDESLDIVAAVLEELTGKGLMVGVITHVKELAARAPVRYEVTREPGGSKVSVLS